MTQTLSSVVSAAYVFGMERITTDILIVGGGVAGLTAAAAFGTAGYSVVLVDPAPPVTSAEEKGADLRTTAFLQPARAFLERAGLWGRLEPHATALQVMRIVDAAGEDPVTADFDASDISDQPFGWNLPNWLLRREMVVRLGELPSVTFLAGVGFADMVPRTAHTLARLTDGHNIQAKLVIGADGRASSVRQAAGIGVKTTRYGQKALTFAVTHDAPHNNVSTEVHKAGGPFTLVPLPDQDGKPCSAVVWMDTGAATLDRASLSPEDFNAAATERSAGVYGPLTLAAKRSIWPIISQLADTMSGPRTALVAEAAHVMPPIGAQGLNMSLGDLAALLDLAMESDDPGAVAVLDAYTAQRHAHVRLRVNGIDALNKASIAGNPMVQALRAHGIKALYGAAPIRRKLMELGLGASDHST